MATRKTIDAAVAKWGEDSSIGQIFAALSPKELPLEAIIGDRTDRLIEVHPLPDRFAVVRLMLTPDELDSLIDTGLIALAPPSDVEPARRDRRN